MTTIVIPVDDWIKEYQTNEPNLSDEDALMQARQQYTTGELARMLLGARTVKAIPEDILQPDKVLLWIGAREEVSLKVTRRRMTVTVKGKDIEVHEFVPWQANGETEDEPDIVHVLSKEAVTYPSGICSTTLPEESKSDSRSSPPTRVT